MAYLGLISGGSAIVYLGQWIVVLGPSVGIYRFLEDHTIDGQYIYAGTVQEMFQPWTPTANVDPLNTLAVNNFYATGPALPSLINVPNFRVGLGFNPVYLPKTYWTEISPNIYALTGLGSDQSTYPPVHARIGSPP
jgi:hypothetical protein